MNRMLLALMFSLVLASGCLHRMRPLGPPPMDHHDNDDDDDDGHSRKGKGKGQEKHREKNDDDD